MQFLRAGTQCTICFGPFVDKTDGVTLKADATCITDIDHATTGIFLSKNGANAAVRHQGIAAASVADDYGMMTVTLDTTDTGTVGTLDVLFAKAATYLPVHKSFMVIPATLYDTLMVAQPCAAINKFFDKASPTGTVNSLPDAVAGATNGLFIAGTNAATVITTSLTTTFTGNLTGTVAKSPATIAAGDIANNAITAAAIADGAIDNATFAADVGSTAYATNIIALAADKAIVNAALATQASVNTIDDFLDTEIAAILADTNELQTNQGSWATATGFATSAELAKVPKSDSNVTWNATALGSINAEVDTALNTAIPGSPTADSINERIVAIDAFGAPPSAASVAALVLVTPAQKLVTDANGYVTYSNAAPPAASAIADAVWDEVLHTDHEVAGSASVLLQAVDSDVDTILADTGELQTNQGNWVTATGFATPTNITAGTITTVTNLTNAPSNGDLTAAMKSSVTAAVPTVANIADGVWDEVVTTGAHDTDTFAGKQLLTVKSQTDKMAFTVDNKVDANVKTVNDIDIDGSGTTLDPWGPA